MIRHAIRSLHDCRIVCSGRLTKLCKSSRASPHLLPKSKHDRYCIHRAFSPEHQKLHPLVPFKGRSVCAAGAIRMANSNDNSTGVHNDYLRVALTAAKLAGEAIKEAFYKEKTIEHKGAVDLVTETDKHCEEIILTAIQNAFPDHKFIGEEGSAAQGFTSELTDDPTWMVDPVDGTTNFVHRFPFVCVCIGLAIQKEVVVGVVYNPILDELYTAVRGKGAFLNGEPLHVSSCKELGSAMIISEIGVTRDDATLTALFGRMSALIKEGRALRCLGSCALDMCCVAAGRADISYEVGFGGPWDVAAASLVVQEAGGDVVDPAGGSFSLMGRRIMATNGHLAQQAAALIAPIELGPKEPRPPTSA